MMLTSNLMYGQMILNVISKADNIISIDLKDMIWELTLRAERLKAKLYGKLVIKLNAG